MDEFTAHGRIEGGKLELASRAFFAEQLQRLPEGTCSVTVKHVRPKTSDLQRGYWFAVVVPMVAEFTGDDEDSVHDDLMAHYGEKVTKRWINKKSGKRRQRTRRVSIMDLNTKQTTDLFDRVRRDFGLRGLDIPEPDPAWRVKRRKRLAEAAEGKDAAA